MDDSVKAPLWSRLLLAVICVAAVVSMAALVLVQLNGSLEWELPLQAYAASIGLTPVYSTMTTGAGILWFGVVPLLTMAVWGTAVYMLKLHRNAKRLDRIEQAALENSSEREEQSFRQPIRRAEPFQEILPHRKRGLAPSPVIVERVTLPILHFEEREDIPTQAQTSAPELPPPTETIPLGQAVSIGQGLTYGQGLSIAAEHSNLRIRQEDITADSPDEFAPQYGLEGEATSLAELKKVLAAKKKLPKVAFVSKDNLNTLTQKEQAQMQKLNSLDPDRIMEQIRLKARAAVGDAPKEAIQQTKAAAIVNEPAKPTAVPPQVQIEKPTTPPPAKYLSADEILALHRQDFEKKKFKPSFLAVTNEEEDSFDRMAKLYYESILEE